MARKKNVSDSRAVRAEGGQPLTESVSFPIPIRRLDGMPTLGRLDLNLTPRQALGLRLVFDGLQTEGAEVQLTAVRPVKRHVDAIRWLLDRVADESE